MGISTPAIDIADKTDLVEANKNRYGEWRTMTEGYLTKRSLVAAAIYEETELKDGVAYLNRLERILNGKVSKKTISSSTSAMLDEGLIHEEWKDAVVNERAAYVRAYVISGEYVEFFKNIYDLLH